MDDIALQRDFAKEKAVREEIRRKGTVWAAEEIYKLRLWEQSET